MEEENFTASTGHEDLFKSVIEVALKLRKTAARYISEKNSDLRKNHKSDIYKFKKEFVGKYNQLKRHLNTNGFNKNEITVINNKINSFIHRVDILLDPDKYTKEMSEDNRSLNTIENLNLDTDGLIFAIVILTMSRWEK